MKVENYLALHETEEQSGEILKIESHWCDDDLVVLCFEGKKVIVIANELKRAIENATNVR